MSPPPRALAVVPALVWVTHVAFQLWPNDDLRSVFWLCNLANALLALGLAARQPDVVAVAFSWLVVGTGAWLIDIGVNCEPRPTQFLTHVVGTGVAAYGVHRLGMPRGTWWRALLALVALQLFCRFFTDPRENMNAAHEVYSYYKKIFPTYLAYWCFMTTLFAGVFFAVERVAGRLGGGDRERHG